MDDIKRYLAMLEANRLADETIAKAAGKESAKPASRPTCLVTSYAKRSDVPDGALLVKMAPKVVNALAAMGLHEPVSISVLPGLWWKVNVDAADLGRCREYGCGYVTLFMSTRRMATMGYEVVDGPFKAWANSDVSRAILEENPGKYWDARISNRTLLSTDGVEPYSSYDDAYASEALLAALCEGQTINVFAGPFDNEDDARYALDLRWESPE